MELQEYKVWDVTTCVFHWLNVLCVLGLIAVGMATLYDEVLGVSNEGNIISAMTTGRKTFANPPADRPE